MEDPPISTRQPFRLLPELLEAIIDHLFDNKTTLASCTLVCRSWLEPSRYRLFYSIRHNILSSPGNHNAFQQFVVSTPQCAHLIRDLGLHSTDAIGIQRPAKIFTSFLSPVLSSLPYLHTLTMSSMWISGDGNTFETLLPLISDSICYTFLALSLYSITPLLPSPSKTLSSLPRSTRTSRLGTPS